MTLQSSELTLVLGGARSGKSRFAEKLVLESSFEPVYLATAEPLDGEMAVRIAAHRARRAGSWQTVEEPLDLVEALARECGPERAVLVDCLTLWLTNLMTDRRDVAAESARLVDALRGLRGAVILVSNEVGQGVVPDNPMSRAFVDHAGRLHQALAARADAVVLLVAGLPQRLK
jgi:adenosylcobinamide kinase/adenosylcobinamide-phosphate guanylyltransferase